VKEIFQIKIMMLKLSKFLTNIGTCEQTGLVEPFQWPSLPHLMTCLIWSELCSKPYLGKQVYSTYIGYTLYLHVHGVCTIYILYLRDIYFTCIGYRLYLRAVCTIYIPYLRDIYFTCIGYRLYLHKVGTIYTLRTWGM